LRQDRAWHRLQERVSKFNQSGKTLGVRLCADRGNAEILLIARNHSNLEKFSRRMQSARGHIQRAMAAAVASRLAEPDGPGDFAAFRQRQKEEALACASNPLQAFHQIRPLMESIFLEPPFRLDQAALPGKTAVEAIARNAGDSKGRSLMILGPSGIGKSRLLARSFAGCAPDSLVPVFLPAARIGLGQRLIDWDSLPGATPGLAAKLEALANDGKFILFLDGLDENPGLLDSNNPAVPAFWALAARNRCIITCRTKYYQQHFLSSPADRIFKGSLREMHLLEWSPAHIQRLYSRIAASSAAQGLRAVEHLARLSPQALAEKMGALRPTGLSAWAYALFFASHPGGKFPANEYEILDYLADLLVRWERGRNPGFPAPDIGLGLLSRLCWHAYQKGDCGQSLKAATSDVLKILRQDYPFLCERQDVLFAALSRMPLLAYDGISNAFEFDSGFGYFLAAKHWIGLAVRGEAEAFRLACQTPLTREISDSIFQGLDVLDRAGKASFHETAMRSFAAARQAFQKDPRTEHVTSMQNALQPMARVDPAGARDFLRDIVLKPRKLPELVILSCARALAYMDDESALAAYLKRLQTNARARETNRGFYLYWLKDGRPTRQGPDWLIGLQAAGWNRTCHWLVQELGCRKSAALRAIHLRAFCDLAETFGPPQARPEDLSRVKDYLERELQNARPLLRRELARFKRVIRATQPARKPVS